MGSETREPQFDVGHYVDRVGHDNNNQIRATLL